MGKLDLRCEKQFLQVLSSSAVVWKSCSEKEADIVPEVGVHLDQRNSSIISLADLIRDRSSNKYAS